jgi:hypothetical protein
MELTDTLKNNFLKYASKFYPVCLDALGLPSIIKIEGKDYKLTCSIDRHHIRKSLLNDLINNNKHSFERESAEKITELYCEEKYSEYKKAVMSL